MTAKDLKNALLQEAVQGKLVPQIESEGNASDLLDAIKAEKAKLIKDGKIKKEKPLSPITEDEIPFDIPENWCWCRLGEIVKNVQYGTSAKSQENGLIPVLRMGNITRDGSVSYEKLVFTSDKNEIENYKLYKGDILFNRTNSAELVGKTAIYLGERESIFAGYLIRLTPIQIDSKYVNYVMNTDYQRNWCDSVKTNGVQQCNINAQNLIKFLIPLPPLSEQKRIVAALEKFMPLIEEYGKKEAELTALNADIAKTLKNAILQEAVQGKLAPQIASEGNAKDLLEEIKKEKSKLIKEGKVKKEKTLPEITEDEIPFDIPENWCWCRLGDLSKLVTKGTTPRGGNVAYKDKGIGFLRAENVAGIQNLDLSSLKYIDNETNDSFLKRSILEANDILITIAGTLGRTAIVKQKDLPLNANQAVSIVRLTNSGQIDLNYLVFAINAPDLQKMLIGQTKVTAIPNLTLEIIENCEIPLPPLAEQKRIVAAIEKLLPLCEKLGE